MFQEQMKFSAGRVRQYKPRLIPTGMVGILMIMAAGLQAAENPASGKSDKVTIEELVVTGTKRAKAEALQAVPIAASVVTAMMLKEASIGDLLQMGKMVPSATFKETYTYPGTQRFWMRGTGVQFSVPSFDPSVAIYQDGVFVAQNIASILESFDMETIEVFRGPQGTLFGRNSTAGAVSTRSRRPGSELTMTADVTFGSFNRNDYEASIGGPVSSTLGLKVAGTSHNIDGWLKNTNPNAAKSRLGQSNIDHIRGTAVWKPIEPLDITYIGEYYTRKGDGSQAVSAGLCGERPCTTTGAPNRGWNQYWDDGFPFPSKMDVTVTKHILDGNYDLGHGVLTSTSGYIDVDEFSGSQFDGQILNLTDSMQMIKQHQFSEELRYASKFSETFDFTTGLYYFTQSIRYGEMRAAGANIGVARPGIVDPKNPYGLTGPGYAELEHKSKAVFLEGHWKITGQLNLTAGGRYTTEDKATKIGVVNGGSCNSLQVPPFYVDAYSCTRGLKGGFDIVDSQGWSDFSPKVALQYQIQDGLMGYASLQRGFQSGGFSMRVAGSELTAPGIRPSYYRAEQVDQAEMGLKSDWWGGRARVNLTGYYQKWKNIQRTIQQSIQVQNTANVADSHVEGIEVEANLILGNNMLRAGDALRLDGSLGRLWSGYDSPYLVTGRYGGIIDISYQNFATPDTTGFASITYDVPVGTDSGKLGFRVAYDYQGPWCNEGAPYKTNIGCYYEQNNIDASIRYTSPNLKWTAMLFAKNLGNQQVMDGKTILSGDNLALAASVAPRTVGITLGYNY